MPALVDGDEAHPHVFVGEDLAVRAAIRDHDQIWWLLVERGAGKSNDRAA